MSTQSASSQATGAGRPGQPSPTLHVPDSGSRNRSALPIGPAKLTDMTEETMTQHMIAQMVFGYAQSAHLGSYDKGTNRFGLNLFECRDLGMLLWEICFNAEQMAEAAARMARSAGIADTYALIPKGSVDGAVH